jgi:drug/metabolite transporter (DMT)-like permease
VAAAIAALCLLGINPFMANGRIFGQGPLATLAFFIPLLATVAFLHFVVPRAQRSTPPKYGLRVLGAAVFAYAAAVLALLASVLALTGELV